MIDYAKGYLTTIEPSPQKKNSWKPCLWFSIKWDINKSDNIGYPIKSKLLHTGNVQIIKTFVCAQCGERYKFKSALADHMNGKHEKYPI